MFAISADVTTAEVYESITVVLRKCNSSLSHCRMALMHQLSYHSKSNSHSPTDSEMSNKFETESLSICMPATWEEISVIYIQSIQVDMYPADLN